jgi:hypothetical protein
LVFLASAPLVFSVSCDDDEQAPPPEPPRPVGMMIGELRPRGSEVWQRDDAEPVVIGCDRRLGVTLYIYENLLSPPSAESTPAWSFTRGDYLLRPPGTCTRTQCGTAKVTVESLANGAVVTAQASVETVVVDLVSLGDTDGTLRIRAELLENGRTLAMRNGQPLADELELSVSSEDCEPDGGAGAGGEAGAGGSPSGGSAGGGGSGNQAGGATGGTAGSAAGAGGAPGGAPGEAGGGGV